MCAREKSSLLESKQIIGNKSSSFRFPKLFLDLIEGKLNLTTYFFFFLAFHSATSGRLLAKKNVFLIHNRRDHEEF